jgi:hypothetical protein
MRGGGAATGDAEETGDGASEAVGDAGMMGDDAPRVGVAVGSVTTGTGSRVVDSKEDAIAAEESTARRTMAAAEDDGGDDLGQDRGCDTMINETGNCVCVAYPGVPHRVGISTIYMMYIVHITIVYEYVYNTYSNTPHLRL